MRIKAKDGALCAMFAVLLAVGGFLRIPLPGVPLTLQSFFVFLAGLLLGKRRGAMACGVYLLVGLFGVPVFAQGGGIGYLLQPTFGYLLGFIPGTFLIGWLREGSDDPFRFGTMLAATLGGLLVIDLCGTLYYLAISLGYLHRSISFWPLLWVCFLSSLPKDLLLMVLAVSVARKIGKGISVLR